MNINWNQIIDVLNSSTRIAGAFFVTSTILCIGYKYETSIIPKVPASIYIFSFTISIFSGSILLFTLCANVYSKIVSSANVLIRKSRARKAHKERMNLTEVEALILMSFIPIGNDFQDVMDLSYKTEKFTKLELSAAVDMLEKKGLLEVQYDRDYCKISNTGRKIALEYLEQCRKNT